MPNASATRFQFIAHALAADGPFRPSITHDSMGAAISVGTTYLVRYARESIEKFASRNEMAFYASPLAQACNRFVGYLSTKAPQRNTPHELYQRMVDNIDGRGNAIDVFWQQFAVQAKARGSMLLLVDMPQVLPNTQADQLAARAAPYWTAIAPETVTDYAVGDDGKFNFIEFSGTWTAEDGAQKPCSWRFDRSTWQAFDREKKTLGSGEFSLGECPVLIFAEGGEFPHFGSFSAIADLSKRLFNLDSELDEILRGQTFSLLTMQVPDQATEAAKIAAAKTAGETISTANLMMHTGQTPAFIAPPEGPARVYLDRIDKMRDQINEVGLNVATVNQRESGIAMQMRFAQINGELSRFAGRMEDLERRAWDLSRRWLGMTATVEVSWPRDFNLADLAVELQVLADMRAADMPTEVIAEQEKRIVALQFAGLPAERREELNAAIDQRLNEVRP